MAHPGEIITHDDGLRLLQQQVLAVAAVEVRAQAQESVVTPLVLHLHHPVRLHNEVLGLDLYALVLHLHHPV